MKYRDLRISFTMEDITFDILSLGKEGFPNPIPMHSHSKNSYEFHYIPEGKGTVIADGKTYLLSPGTFFVTGPGVEHEQISDTDEPMIEYGLYLQVSYEEKALNRNRLADFIAQTFWIGPVGHELKEIMEKIFYELDTKIFGYELMTVSLIQQLILTIARYYNTPHGIQKEFTFKENKPQDMLYLTIEEAFLYDYKDLTLEGLAKKINLGTRQTERLLLKYYNKTFTKKKNEARLFAASLMLKNSNDPISSIAEKLGFSSTEHFSNAFKAYYGVTPGKYRKS